ncbi:hypothetical protein, partial [Faecalibaculum rodentium]|uniref:hypothetical protein n=1 Tax=Faecalibaculum rodentium TaxID=1702221 RepID=UPI0023F1C26B
MSGEYQWNLQTFFPFITRKRGCNQPTDRKTGLTVTTPFLDRCAASAAVHDDRSTEQSPKTADYGS